MDKNLPPKEDHSASAWQRSIDCAPAHHREALPDSSGNYAKPDIKDALRSPFCITQAEQIEAADRIESLERQLADMRASGKVIIASELARTKEIISLRDQLAEASKDAQRMDWIESQGNDSLCWMSRQSILGRGYRLHQDPEAEYLSAREAIDAAMKDQA